MIDVRRNRNGDPRRGFSSVSAFVLSIALFVLPSCGDDSNPVAPPHEDELIATDLTDPSEVIAAHAKAIINKDFVAYAALLDSDFEFLPRGSSGSWNKAFELQMMERLFDENYLKIYENEVVLQGAETIQFTATVLDVRPMEDSLLEVTCGCRGFVITSPTVGWGFRTRLVFTLVPREGFLRILKIVESEDPAFPLWTSWASIKRHYD